MLYPSCEFCCIVDKNRAIVGRNSEGISSSDSGKMGLHQKHSRGVSAEEVILGAYYQGQDSTGDPDEYLTLAAARELERSGQGRFINRGRAFRLFTRATPHDPSQYRSSGRHRGESLNIDPEMIERYLGGERYAVAAVKAWR
jgi:hypothetical protein